MVPVGWLVGQLGSVLKNPSLVELDYRCWSFVFGVFMCQLVYRYADRLFPPYVQIFNG
jgi:hypothetical protein